MSGKKKIYCICKKPAESNRFMICCDKCDNWFHGSCVEVTKSNKPRGKWLCPPCESHTRNPDKNVCSKAKVNSKADSETQFKEFKNSIISDVTSSKQQLASLDSEVQILKSQVSSLERNQENVERKEKEFKDILQQKNQEKLKQRERELVQLYEQKYNKEVQQKYNELNDLFEQKIREAQEELTEKEKDLRDSFDAKKRCYDEEWEEKIRNVEIECERKVNELITNEKKIIKDLKEKLDEKCKELEEAKNEIQSLKTRTTKRLSLKKTPMSQPVNLKKDYFELRDEEDFKIPPK